MSKAFEWFLIRTKAGKERKANEYLTRFVDQAFLPLMNVRLHRWGKLVESVTPLFTCYLFALFDFEHDYNHVRHTSGVQYVVHHGGEPAVVPEWIVHELRARCARGPIEMAAPDFAPGEAVRIVDGPFREFEGIFERRLAGPERVAILLSAMGAGARVVLPVGMVERAN